MEPFMIILIKSVSYDLIVIIQCLEPMGFMLHAAFAMRLFLVHTSRA